MVALVLGLILLGYIMVLLRFVRCQGEDYTPVQGEPVIQQVPISQWRTIGKANFVNMPTWFKLKGGTSEPDAWIYTLQGRVVPGRDNEKYEYRVFVYRDGAIGGVWGIQHLNRIVETGKIVDGDTIHTMKEMAPMKVRIKDNNWDVPWQMAGWGLYMKSENVNPSYTLEGRKIGNKYEYRLYQGIYPKTQEKLALRNKMLRNRETVVAESGNEFMVFITYNAPK